MMESQKFKEVIKLVREHKQLSQIAKNIKILNEKYPNLAGQPFLSSSDYCALAKSVTNLQLEGLEELIGQLYEPQSILVLPLQDCQAFAMYFVILPSTHMFNWHSHPKMVGMTKCLHGELQVNTINTKLLKPQVNMLSYPKEHLRTCMLRPNCRQIAEIEPQSHNIHRIKPKKLSAFLDVMLPNYPENICDFFKLKSQNEETLFFKQIKEPQQPVQLLETYCSRLKEVQKFTHMLPVFQNKS